MKFASSLLADRYSDLGFPKTSPIASLQSIAHLFGSTKDRCGIYLLEFPQERFYVGQAIEVVRRFAQHRRNYDDIIGFSFIPTRRKLLDTTEQELIHAAERIGLVLLNTVFATNIVGDTDLDLVVPIKEQETWLASPKAFNQQESIQQIVLPDPQVQRFAGQFRKFKQHPHAEATLQLLQTYVNNCIPSPKRTEYSFWASSCCPTTNRNTWPRLACINMGVMEVFVIGHYKEDPLTLWGFINVASDVILDEFGSEREFRKWFPTIEMSNSNYRDAGQHQCTLQGQDGMALRTLVQHPVVQRAAATLALRVMRKRPTIYGKFHCRQLAESIFLDSDARQRSCIN